MLTLMGLNLGSMLTINGTSIGSKIANYWRKQMYSTAEYTMINIGMFSRLTEIVDAECRKQNIDNTCVLSLNYTWDPETKSYSKEFHVPQSNTCVKLSSLTRSQEEEIEIVPLKINQSNQYDIDKYLIMANSRQTLIKFLKPLWKSVGMNQTEIDRLTGNIR